MESMATSRVPRWQTLRPLGVSCCCGRTSCCLDGCRTFLLMAWGPSTLVGRCRRYSPLSYVLHFKGVAGNRKARPQPPPSTGAARKSPPPPTGAGHPALATTTLGGTTLGILANMERMWSGWAGCLTVSFHCANFLLQGFRSRCQTVSCQRIKARTRAPTGGLTGMRRKR